MVKTYTDRYEGYQIRDINYLGEPPKDAPIAFDIVKWYKDYSLGTELCYSVANLVFNPKEPCFELKSIGIRWLEAHPSEMVEDWLIKWCDYKIQELKIDN